MSRELVDHLQHVLQYFLFSCFSGGFRISDITRLTHDNITGGRITFFMYKNRRKKKKRISIVLNNSAQLLLTSHNGKLFQTYCDQITNRHLKEIARIAGIDKKITFHVARHTFATHFLMAGGKVEVLKDILGHSKIETTMRYVHIVDESKNEQLKTLDEKYLREMFGFNNLAMVI
jgi:site-specific recombinase XerD